MNVSTAGSSPVSYVLAVSLLLAPAAVADDGAAVTGHFWPQWRGPLGTGEAPHARPPLHWGESKNVRWKIQLPGKGHSTPIVWGDRIFLTAAVPYGDAIKPRYSGVSGAHDNLPVTRAHEFVVLAVSRASGKIIWQRTVSKQLPHEGGHHTASLASASPVTDGELLFAFFGSRGLYCFGLDGKPKWDKDLGVMRTKHGHGEGSSPALYGQMLIINWDHEGRSFLTALDKHSGKQRWKVDRHEVTSWATPIVVEHDGKPQVVVSGTKRVRGYDLATGRVIWECRGLSANVVASPVAGHGLVFAASSYDSRAIMAIRLDGARGDITGTDRVAWSRKRRTPYVPSPLLYADSLYFVSHYQGVLTRVDAATGRDRPGAFRLDGIGNIYASPIAAAGRVYITGRDGTTLVISHDDQPRVLAINRLDDRFSASAAAVGPDLFLRGHRYLYRIAEKQAGRCE